MNIRIVFLPMVFGLCLIFSNASRAQCVLTDNTVTFEIEDTSPNSSPSADLVDTDVGGGDDQIFEWGYFFRLSGDTDETAFQNPDSIDCNNATGIMTWNNLDGRGILAATVVYTLADMGTGSTLVTEVEIRNLTPDTVNVEIFNYADLDVGPNPVNNSASEVGSNVIEITDSTTTLQYASPNATGYAVLDFFEFVSDLGLREPGVTDFTNTGLPFPPGDFTGGFQHSLSLAGGAATTLYFSLGVNVDAPVSVGISDAGGAIVGEMLVEWSAYPNPFTGQTHVAYHLNTPTDVQLQVYDALGRHVHTLVNARHSAGRHQAVWVPESELAAGVYLLYLKTETLRQTRVLVMQ